MLNVEKNNEIRGNENETEMSRLINETTSSILRIYQEFGPQAVEDWEVNELLEWTHNLNYDEYLIDWRTIGTSASSNVLYGKDSRSRKCCAVRLISPMSDVGRKRPLSFSVLAGA